MTHPNNSEVAVTGCRTCPMRNIDYENGSWCNHADGPGWAYEEGPGSPDECPLRKGPVTLRLKEGV